MAATTQTIQKMYIAYFGRPADTIGLQYWADKTEAQIIAGFSASSESQALFGNQGSAAKVNAIYNNLFARDAEPAGLQYWVQKLNSGEVSQAEAMYTILNNAGAGDATAVANKLAAAEAFTAQIDTTPEILGYSGANAAQSAREWLGKVNANVASLDAAKASAPAALAAAAAASAGDSGKTFMLTKGLDTLTGTAGNDTFIGSISADAELNTLSALDSADGGAGVDTLKIADDKGTAITLPNIKNVEVVEVQGTKGITIDTTSAVGVTNLNVVKAVGAVDATAGATTDISVALKEDNGAGQLDNVVKGGKNVTVTATDLGVATADAAKADKITVGGAGSAAAAGDVVVNATGAKSVAATNKVLSAVEVTGGKTVSVTQKASSDCAGEKIR